MNSKDSEACKIAKRAFTRYEYSKLQYTSPRHNLIKKFELRIFHFTTLHKPGVNADHF